MKCSLNCAMMLTGNNIQDREETKRTSVAGLPGVRTIHSAITTLAHKFAPRNATYGSFKVKNKEFFAQLIFHPTFWMTMAVFSGALKSRQGFHANEVTSSSSSNWSVFIKAKFVIKFLSKDEKVSVNSSTRQRAKPSCVVSQNHRKTISLVP